MTEETIVPKKTKVLILGGGIHGVGVLHDLVSRGWDDVVLIEKEHLASGTSSKSTKLIHGGLRYLARVSQFKMVKECLKERDLLLNLAGDVVKPIEIVIPIMKKDILQKIKFKIGLSLYDQLAGKYQIHPHKRLNFSEIEAKVPILDLSNIKGAYSYWDAQTDDALLVNKIARLAQASGGTILEGSEAINCCINEKKWLTTIRKDGKNYDIESSFIINCLGPWANQFLENCKIKPSHEGFNNKGSHLVVKDLGLKSGLLLETTDQRVLFILPWNEKTLIGTTEKLYTGNPSDLKVDDEEIDYLLRECNYYLKDKIYKKDIKDSFAGLRWLAKENNMNISGNTRETIVGEIFADTNCSLMTIYGGKLTSYRLLAQKIGDKIFSLSKDSRPTGTKNEDNWILQKKSKNKITHKNSV